MLIDLVRISAPVTLSSYQDGKPRSFDMVAYTGAPVDLGDDAPWIFDLDGMTWDGVRPIFRDHDAQKLVGHGSPEIGKGALRVTGTVLTGSPFADALFVSLASDQGFPWQASIGVRIKESYRLGVGEFASVNGRRVEGPMNVGSQTELDEVSFVPLGADGATSARVLSRNRKEAAMPEEMAPEEQKKDEELTLAAVAAFLGMTEEQVAALMEPEVEEEKDDDEEEVEMSAAELAAQIRDAFPGDPDFALAQVCAGNDLIAAKAAYADHVSAKLASAREEIKRLEVQLAARPGTKPVPVADSGPVDDGATDFLGLAKAKAAEEKTTITAAMKALARSRSNRSRLNGRA